MFTRYFVGFAVAKLSYLLRVIKIIVAEIFLMEKGYTFRGGNSTENVCIPSEKNSTLNGKNSLLWKQIFFPFWADSFQKRLRMREYKQQITVIFLVKVVAKSATSIHYL